MTDRPEDRLQQAVHVYLENVLCHDIRSPNFAWHTFYEKAGKRTRLQGALLAQKGVRSGVPDGEVVYQQRKHCIELKWGKNGLTDSQMHQFPLMRAANIPIAVCYSVQDVHDALVEWSIPLRHHSLTPAMRDEMLAARVAAKPGKTRQNSVERGTRRVSKRALRFAAKAQMP